MNNSILIPIEPVNKSHLRRLFILRSLTIIVQVCAMLFAEFFLEIQLDLLPMVICVIGLLLFNTYVWRRINNDKPVSNNEIFGHLIVDVLALTLVLYFSGGASNPFVTLFLFPIIVSVTILPKKYAWVLAVLSIACYTVLIFYFEPIGINGMQETHASMGLAFSMHIIGMWLAFILSAGFIAFFVMKMGQTIHEQETLLLKAQETALRDQRIIALGSLAAATAHELGTPLGTMNLLASELKQQLPDAPRQVKKDLELLKQQIALCKKALSNLSHSAGTLHLAEGNILPVHEFLQKILDSWQLMRPEVKIHCLDKEGAPEARILNELTISQAITNILDNAADVSPDDVECAAAWNQTKLIMEIRDRGPGMANDLKNKLGKAPHSEKDKGLGIGLLLSHAIIERFGGEVQLFDREGGGMIVRVTLPLINKEIK